MPLKDYTTKINADQTAREIISLLVRKGAVRVMLDYGPAGQHTGLKWQINAKHGPLYFSLPINVEAVYYVLTHQGVLRTNTAARRMQAERTAWRIVKDWIAAQMALIESQMVTFEEVFLPYMLSDDQTLYQALRERQFQLLPSIARDIALPE